MLKKVSLDCDVINDPLHLMAFVLSSFNEEDLVLNTLRCQSELLKNKNYKYILNYGTVRFPITKTEKIMVEKKWQKIKKQEEMLNRFLLFDEKSERSKNITYLVKELDYFEKYDQIESTIIQLFILKKLGNLGAQDILIEKYLKEHPLKYSLGRTFPYHKEREIEDKVSRLLISYLSDSSYNNRNNLLTLKLIYDSNKSLKESLQSELRVPSFSSLNKLIKSPNYGGVYTNTWMFWVYEHYPAKNRSQMMNKYYKDVDWIHLYSLKYHYIKNPKLRESLFPRILELSKSQDVYKKAMYFEIMKNNSWNEYFSQKIDKFNINFIKSRRSFYRFLIEGNVGGAYPVFELFKMGDISREYFIYLLAIKSYGLQTTQILPLQ